MPYQAHQATPETTRDDGADGRAIEAKSGNCEKDSISNHGNTSPPAHVRPAIDAEIAQGTIVVARQGRDGSSDLPFPPPMRQQHRRRFAQCSPPAPAASASESVHELLARRGKRSDAVRRISSTGKAALGWSAAP